MYQPKRSSRHLLGDGRYFTACCSIANICGDDYDTFVDLDDSQTDRDSETENVYCTKLHGWQTLSKIKYNRNREGNSHMSFIVLQFELHFVLCQ